MVTCIFVVTVVMELAMKISIPDRLVRLKRLEIPLARQSDKMGFPAKTATEVAPSVRKMVKGSVLDIVYSSPRFLRRYKRWFR
jgi:hypothetical protein